MRKMRHYQRYTVSGSGFIYWNLVQKAEFSINDISASGINITAEIELQEHEVVLIEVQFSGNLLPFDKQLRGKVTRKRKHNSIYNYGIRFISLAPKDIVEIDEYLRLNHGSTTLHRDSQYNEPDSDPLKQLIRTNNSQSC